MFGAGETTRLWQLIRAIEKQTGKAYPEALLSVDAAILHTEASGYLEHPREMALAARRICDKCRTTFYILF